MLSQSAFNEHIQIKCHIPSYVLREAVGIWAAICQSPLEKLIAAASTIDVGVDSQAAGYHPHILYDVSRATLVHLSYDYNAGRGGYVLYLVR